MREIIRERSIHILRIESKNCFRTKNEQEIQYRVNIIELAICSEPVTRMIGQAGRYFATQDAMRAFARIMIA
jgi:hypothetical protein